MIEKILAILNSIPSDKVAHCLGGVVLFAIGQLFGYGLALAILGAVTKEIYDYFHPEKHTADVKDAIATTLGGLLGYIIYLGY
jgi:glycopeptide antibiotics resistance protein